jgi:hypothetical protein
VGLVICGLLAAGVAAMNESRTQSPEAATMTASAVPQSAWEGSFHKAQEAFTAKKWQEAAEQCRLALDADKQEQKKKAKVYELGAQSFLNLKNLTSCDKLLREWAKAGGESSELPPLRDKLARACRSEIGRLVKASESALKKGDEHQSRSQFEQAKTLAGQLGLTMPATEVAKKLAAIEDARLAKNQAARQEHLDKENAARMAQWSKLRGNLRRGNWNDNSQPPSGRVMIFYMERR